MSIWEDKGKESIYACDAVTDFLIVFSKFRNIFNPYDDMEMLRDKIFGYLGVLDWALHSTKSNEEITQYIKELVERIKKIAKAHNINDFNRLKKNLEGKKI